MSLVRNEQAKLTATFLNGVAIALFAVGTLTPVLSILYGDRRPTLLILVGIAVCIVASGALHFGARRLLKGLVP
ncbi:hypothetical protein [Rubellimicrobium aerolatum]|uniref:Amino acid transporter n=1 Tax=Rubellimicrobium aerolatum TaxID=490979 RepID=A0ABW0S7E5_9RHOB|nr:hypothetical protein [Rubellimicrobium aerolatum]MBP1804524.1 nitrogen fixation-related uncharacterized protein [Rubellimicrobium aerolatum]